ncbi:MAG: hypothetical protein ACXACI_16995 [Candidatus Hodarchaeales archaeon]|jgi:hypothetical protein
MKASDLKEGYRQALALPLTLSKFSEVNEQLFVLHKSNWIRILFVRRVNDIGNTIEIELSLPSNINTTRKQLVESIVTLIEYLNYFLELEQFGFQMDVMEQDFLWTATIDVNEHFDDELFEVLVPPTI